MGRFAVNFIVLGLFVCGLAACTREPPEQRLRQTVRQMQAAVEAADTGSFMAPVSPDFVGNGGLDRDGLERMLKAHLLLNRNVRLQTGPLTVQMAAGMDTATVRFTVLMVGGSGRFLPERGQVQEIVSGWRDERGQWRLHSAHWEPAGSR